ncbi:hypothetical protein [uncultured Pseudodesulfovibrio sp.]|uniref:hypothetical protein n=1 Tax=uncultured Pseudodesulfovibrio sp. TaxID=2035858 RepID=UPI0029C89320|nr:hypothetical protein [uncultured Pseudodesulfovibrio sp.]
MEELWLKVVKMGESEKTDRSYLSVTWEEKTKKKEKGKKKKEAAFGGIINLRISHPPGATSFLAEPPQERSKEARLS